MCMNKSATNIAIILGLITIAFAGYYLYTTQFAADLQLDATNEQTLENMLAKTSVFMSRRQSLERVDIDLEFFVDKRFTTLENYATPLTKPTFGQPVPFIQKAAEEDVNN